MARQAVVPRQRGDQRLGEQHLELQVRDCDREPDERHVRPALRKARRGVAEPVLPHLQLDPRVAPGELLEQRRGQLERRPDDETHLERADLASAGPAGGVDPGVQHRQRLRAASRNTSPAGVSSTDRVVRRSSGTPMASSSSLVCLLSACWATNNRAAAR